MFLALANAKLWLVEASSHYLLEGIKRAAKLQPNTSRSDTGAQDLALGSFSYCHKTLPQVNIVHPSCGVLVITT